MTLQHDKNMVKCLGLCCHHTALIKDIAHTAEPLLNIKGEKAGITCSMKANTALEKFKAPLIKASFFKFPEAQG